MERTFQTLLNIDIFGETPTLRIGNSSSNKSYPGLIFSFIIFFLIGGLASYFTYVIFTHSSPSIIFSQKNYENPSSVTFTRKNFTLAISLIDKDTNLEFFDETLYYIEAFNYHTIVINGTMKDISTFLPIVRCNLSYFPHEVQDQFSKMNLDSMYCVDDVPINLIGTWLTPEFSDLEYRIYECKNSTKNNNSCQSKEEIDKKLSSIFVSSYFVDLTIDPNNLTSPVQYFQGDYFDFVSNSNHKEYYLTFKTDNIYTDLSYVFSDYTHQVFASSYTTQTMYDPNQSSDGNFYKLIIRLSNLETSYFRSYMKFQTAAALLGGILSAFQTFVFLILSVYNKLKFFERVGNVIFDFEWRKGKTDLYLKKVTVIQNNNDITEKQPKTKINNLVDESFEDQLRVSDFNHQNFRKRSKISSILKNVEQKKMEISFLDNFRYIYYLICPNNKNEKMKFINFGIEEINRKLDILYILKKLEEIDKLKRVIFDENQIILFNFSQKMKVIDYNLPKDKISIKSNTINPNQPNEILIKAYERILEKIRNNNFTDIDQKLHKFIQEYEELHLSMKF